MVVFKYLLNFYVTKPGLFDFVLRVIIFDGRVVEAFALVQLF